MPAQPDQRNDTKDTVGGNEQADTTCVEAGFQAKDLMRRDVKGADGADKEKQDHAEQQHRPVGNGA